MSVYRLFSSEVKWTADEMHQHGATAEGPVEKQPLWANGCLPSPQVSSTVLPGPWASVWLGDSVGQRHSWPWLVPTPRVSGHGAERSHRRGGGSEPCAGRQD